jgi:hypothetical protein
LVVGISSSTITVDARIGRLLAAVVDANVNELNAPPDFLYVPMFA